MKVWREEELALCHMKSWLWHIKTIYNIQEIVIQQQFYFFRAETASINWLYGYAINAIHHCSQFKLIK
jgi:hypothetical protein